MELDNQKFKNYFWLLLDLVLAAFFLNLVLFVMPTLQKFGNSFLPARTLSVTSDGKAYAVPDIAELSFSVVSRGTNPNSLADENNKKINTAIAFVKSQGIGEKDIKTVGYNLSPDYRYDPDTGQSSIVSYTLTQTVRLKIRDFGKISPIMGGLTPLGINQISGVNFTIEEPEKFLTEARAEAFKKAKEKAERIAAQSGVSLGRVVSVGEYGGVPPIPYYAKEMIGLGGGDAITPPVIEPGQEEIRVNVTVTYELR